MTFMVHPYVLAVAGGGGAAPEYVGGRTHSFIGTLSTTSISLAGTLTGGLDDTPTEDDLVIVSYGIESGSDIDVTISTGGYTEVADLYGNDSIDVNLGVFRKFMGAVPDTDVVVGATGGTANPGAVVIQVWRGVDLTTPMDAAATTATGTNGGNPDPPAITPSTTDAMIIVCAAANALNGGATLSQSGSELSNFIAVYSDNANALNDDVTVAMGSKLWTGGAFNPVALVGNVSGSLAWCAVTMALRPA
jgi:hypothetical protein